MKNTSVEASHGIFVLLNNFEDREGAYIAPSLDGGIEPGRESEYVVETVALTQDPVVSCGGFKLLPDHRINDILPAMRELYELAA